MRAYLAEKQYASNEINDTINWLIERNYLNDARFADDWVKARLRTAPRGRQRLLLELRQKGIDKATAENAVAENLEPGSDESVAFALLQRHRSRWKGSDWLEIERKMINFLRYRGFAGDEIISACKRYKREEFAADA